MRRRFYQRKKKHKIRLKKELQFIPLNTLNANIFHVHARDFFYFYFIWRVRCSVFDYAHLSNSHLHTPELLWHSQGIPSKRQQQPKKNLPLWNIDLLQVKKTTINLLVCTGKREADTNLMRITHIHSEESSSKKYRMRQEQKKKQCRQLRRA